jgi:radical SAM superfamily enzyme YgiQ (UPF0313 family)
VNLGETKGYGDFTRKIILAGDNVKVLLTSLNAKYIHSSLALRYLKAYCRDICPDIVIKEYTINNELLHVLAEIFAERPNVLGMACYIWNVEATLKLAVEIKKVLPETIIVLGGPEVSYDAAQILKDNPAVDYLIQGEGEEALARLLAALVTKEQVPAIPGVAWRSDVAVVDSTPQAIKQLDAVPFPYGSEDIAELKDKIIYYESSRGCPFSCQYCLSSATQGVRYFNLERVLSDLKVFLAHKVKQVKFVDRTFNAKKVHYLPIWQFLAGVDTDTNFHFEIAADLLDDDVIDFLATVPTGRFQFEIGIQSTNSQTLTAICRNNDWPRIVHNVKRLRAADNIHLHLDLIAGLPYEDYWLFGKSFNDVYALQPHMLQLGFLKMLKGSGIRLSADKHQYKYLDIAPYEVLANKYLPYADVRRLKIMEEIFSQVYNNGRFKAVLRWFSGQYHGDAFRFFHDLTLFWEQTGLHLVAHSVKAIYHHLSEFCRQGQPSRAELCGELLKFDALTDDAGAIRPTDLPWNDEKWADERNAFWRNEAVVRKYLPEYHFTNWRELKKKYHIEVFRYDIPAWLGSDAAELAADDTAVLFSYAGKCSEYKTIDAADFWPEGE